ncbi:hypothetical protein [Ciceribacter selenitireducens]|uniref:Uncharacterized protein n=1 Tax=Ciceribacter selenitireducens ATCC BAA-1503 TaxID=1336235 RepID=A0A376AHL1_9HYPH|nr:hypothetical protein [Ciceribacter selenitireducens]SSC67331.1 unnamed protein product [Ciceribacter selenitireducens ATCC BAA-1503]
MDWTEALIAAGEIARQAAIDVPRRLAAKDLTAAEAHELFVETERNAQAMDDLVDRMADDPSLAEAQQRAAEIMQDVWGRLVIAAMNRVRELDGLPPVEFLGMEDDE